jgi:hypothetical protein
MSATVRIGEVDLVGDAELRDLAQHSGGPCLSILMPTHRAGAETRQDPIRLANLLDEARARLDDAGVAAGEAEGLLAPHRALLGDHEFWRFLADGLALYSAPGLHRRFRVPIALPDEVAVGPSFRIRPLLPLAAGDGHFFVLALAQNQVTLYQATRSTIAELPAGPIPPTIDDALAYEDPERQLQYRSNTGQTAQFHGHGVGGELDKQALERFLRAVDRGVVEVLGGDPSPLVLASVAYYVPIYRSVTRHPNVLERGVEGSPERRSPADLHAAAWSLVEPVLAAAREQSLDRIRTAPAERVAFAITDVVTAAHEGRVDTLLLSDGPPLPGHVDATTGAATPVDEAAPGTEDLLDRAAIDTLRHGGRVFVVDEAALDDSRVAALLRF